MKPLPETKKDPSTQHKQGSVSPRKTTSNNPKSETKSNMDATATLQLPLYIEYISIYDTSANKHIVELNRLNPKSFTLEAVRKDNLLTIERAVKRRLVSNEVKVREALNKQYSWSHVLNSNQLLISTLSYKNQIDSNKSMATSLNGFLTSVAQQIDRKDLENEIYTDLNVFFQEFASKAKDDRRLGMFGDLLDNMKITLVDGKEKLEDVDIRGQEMAIDARELDANADELARNASATNRVIKIILVVSVILLAIILIAMIIMINARKTQDQPVSRRLFQDVSITGMKIARMLSKSGRSNTGLHRRWLI